MNRFHDAIDRRRSPLFRSHVALVSALVIAGCSSTDPSTRAARSTGGGPGGGGGEAGTGGTGGAGGSTQPPGNPMDAPEVAPRTRHPRRWMLPRQDPMYPRRRQTQRRLGRIRRIRRPMRRRQGPTSSCRRLTAVSRDPTQGYHRRPIRGQVRRPTLLPCRHPAAEKRRQAAATLRSTSPAHRVPTSSKIPTTYDMNRPYRLIFAWHGKSGSAAQTASGGYYRIETRSAGPRSSWRAMDSRRMRGGPTRTVAMSRSPRHSSNGCDRTIAWTITASSRSA